MVYIIGSGLSGIATAAALVKRGVRPIIIDAGLPPDARSVALKSRLASSEPEDWAAEDLAELKKIGPVAGNGIPRKLHFGSDFAYREVDQSTAPRYQRASILRSLARGGFSNVWGAVTQPWPEREFQTWPVKFADLVPHYQAIRDLMGASDVSVQPSSQARALYRDLGSHRAQLDAEGVRFDYASLAVRPSEETTHGCRHCGLCLYGCPYDSIFSASSQLARMVQRGEVGYLSDVLVDRVSMTAHGIAITGRSRANGSVRTFCGGAVFVACGLLETARIVLNSLSLGLSRLKVQQSDIFTLPLVRYRAAANIDTERLHTLCQMVLEITDRAICSESIQLQLYAYNDLYSQILSGKLGALARPLNRWIPRVSERIITAFGYLHSKTSSPVWITRSDRGHGALEVCGDVSPDRNIIGKAVLRKMFRLRNCLQAVPAPLQLQFDIPGGGHRTGGAFPMMPSPDALQTDVLGRFPQLAGVHLVDSSVLPAIPAAPLAFTVMANAHRIATECPIRDVA